MMDPDALANRTEHLSSASERRDWRELVFPDWDYAEIVLPRLAPPVVLAPPPKFVARQVPYTELTIRYPTFDGEWYEDIEEAHPEEWLAVQSLPEGFVACLGRAGQAIHQVR